MAQLVSRNAGYQMSDLQRYNAYRNNLAGIPLRLQPALNGLTENEIQMLFAFLEAPNFLIFRDAYPQLALYHWAKRLHQATGADHSAELFDLLIEEDFRVNHFLSAEWKTFFGVASGAGWWDAAAQSNDPAVRRALYNNVAIIRLSVSLIANEQNQIELRSVNDPSRRYLGVFDGLTKTAVRLASVLQLTILVFPNGATVADPAATGLSLYTVQGFEKLDDRIRTGRNLYANAFLEEDARRESMVAWAVGHPEHHGSRVDYDPGAYSTDPGSASVPFGATYSPPLVPFQGFDAVWPIEPGLSPAFAHLHGEPTRLPEWSIEQSQVVIDGQPVIDRWTGPLPPAPSVLFVPHPLGNRAEIFG